MSKKTNFSPTAAIKDPAVRSCLESIIRHLRECSGEAGTSDQKYVTEAEMTAAIAKATK